MSDKGFKTHEVVVIAAAAAVTAAASYAVTASSHQPPQELPANDYPTILVKK